MARGIGRNRGSVTRVKKKRRAIGGRKIKGTRPTKACKR